VNSLIIIRETYKVMYRRNEALMTCMQLKICRIKGKNYDLNMSVSVPKYILSSICYLFIYH